ncbi:MAG: tetratricopeptide repeat protein [Bacteroidales bacterium]|nr:tetratricopeptide repeat protein [Bacteroidales bacterium]
MRHSFAVFLCMASICLTHANNIDRQLEKADSLIETDPQTALTLCRGLSGKELSARQKGILYHVEGNALFAQGDNAEAKSAFKKSIEATRAAGDSATWASALSDLGVCYRVTDRPDSALMMYNKALEILEKLDADAEKASLLTSIAVLYANQGRFAESIKYGRRAFETAKKSGDMECLMYAGQTLGIVLYLSGDKDGGLSIEREMVAIAERQGMPRYMLKTYASIIDMHYKDGHRDSVEHYMALGRSILPQVPEASVEALGFMEESYVVLTAYGQYQESLDLQKKILSMRGAGTFMPFNKLYQRMARNYKGLGDIERMGEAYERAIALTDSLHGLEVDRQLSEFDVKYDTARRELQIATLEIQKERQLLWTIITVIISIFMITGIIVWMHLRRRNMRRRMELEAARQQLEAVDHERARFAAELHDGVCSDLTGIALLIQTGRVPQTEIVDTIDNVRKEVRSISHSLMPPRFEGLTFEQLLEGLTRDYPQKITIDCAESADMDSTVAFQPYRIVQEWLSNVNRHSEATELHIALSGNSLVLTDNGAPYTSGYDGIGTETMKRRSMSIGAEMEFERNTDKNVLSIRFEQK